MCACKKKKRIVKPDIFDIVGTGLWSPRWKRKSLKLVNDANRFSVRLGDRKKNVVSIKVIEVYGKSPHISNVCVCVSSGVALSDRSGRLSSGLQRFGSVSAGRSRG